MKKLLFKCALLALVTAAVLYLGGAAYRRTTAWRNLERTENTEKYREMPEAVDIAVFGSSHGRDAFQYFPDGADCFNFSLSGQSLQYDNLLMKEYEDRFRPQALVLLTVGYPCLFRMDPEADFQSKQNRYYRILSPWNIQDADWVRWGLGKISPLLTEDFPDIAAAFLNPEPLKPTLMQREGKTRLSGLSEEDTLLEAERIGKAHHAIIDPAFPEGNPVMTDALRDMLVRCKERGWQAVLVVPPFPDVYNEQFSSEFYQAFDKLLNQLSGEYGVPLLDYSHDPAFTERYDLFRDVQHMNLEGAESFSRRFFEDLRALEESA